MTAPRALRYGFHYLRAVFALRTDTEQLPASAYQRGTFTVSTLGATGIDWFTPVLNPPQVAILGVGRVAQRAVVVDDMIVARPMMTLTLVFDHRALDGHPAGLFLSDVARRLGTGDF